MKHLYLILLAAAIGAGPSAAETGDRADAGKEAADYLEIYTQFNSRCQGLQRGDIRMVRNVHDTRPIEYRMIRLLGGKRQASLIQDVIKPGDEGQALGCELLDHHEQTWEIVRARFVDADAEAGGREK